MLRSDCLTPAQAATIPGEVFQGDWYRHYKQMFADQL
jgi:hypothetical protein